MAAIGRCQPASSRFQRGPIPLESRPDASGGHRPNAARVRSPSLDVFMIDRTLKLLLTGRWENTFSASGHSFGSRFTSCELTGRWTPEFGAASSHSFFSKSSKPFALPVPNQVPTPIRSKYTPIGTDVSDLSQTLKFFKIFCLRL